MTGEHIMSLDSHIKKLRMDSEMLRTQISTLKPEHDISIDFHLKNLQKMALQSLDLFTTMQKQVSLLNYQFKFKQSRQK